MTYHNECYYVANVYAGFVTRSYIIIVNMYNTVSWMSTMLVLC